MTDQGSFDSDQMSSHFRPNNVQNDPPKNVIMHCEAGSKIRLKLPLSKMIYLEQKNDKSDLFGAQK